MTKATKTAARLKDVEGLVEELCVKDEQQHFRAYLSVDEARNRTTHCVLCGGLEGKHRDDCLLVRFRQWKEAADA